MADEWGSGGRTKVDHQGAIGRFKIQKMTLDSVAETGSGQHVGYVIDAAPAGSIWDLDQFGVWRLTAELHLRTKEKKHLFSHKLGFDGKEGFKTSDMEETAALIPGWD